MDDANQSAFSSLIPTDDASTFLSRIRREHEWLLSVSPLVVIAIASALARSC